MFGTILLVGAGFGLVAGVFLGLPALAMGAFIGVAVLLGLDLAAGVSGLDIALRVVGLAVSLQIAYALGLAARATFPALRRGPPRENPEKTRGRER